MRTTAMARAWPAIIRLFVACKGCRRNKATLAAINPPAVKGFIAIMPGAKFFSGSTCRIHPVRTVAAIAPVSRQVANGAIWVIGDFKRLWEGS